MAEVTPYSRLVRDNPGFRRLWLADLTSLTGDWFNTIALITAVEQLVGTNEAVGWVLIAKALPVLIASPIAGPLVDRLPLRTLMIFSDVGRAVFALGLIVAFRLDSAAALFALTAVSMLLAGVFLPAKNAALPRLVAATELGVANALVAATWSVTLALGAAVGGLATEWLGIEGAFAIDALTYIASALLLRGLPRCEPTVHAHHEHRGFVAGLSYLLGRPRLLPVLLMKSGMACTAGASALLAVYGNRVLSSTPAPWIVGLLFAGRGIGAAFGSIVSRSVLGESRFALQKVGIAGFAITGGAYLWLAAASSVATCMLAIAIAGVGNSLIWVASSILLQRDVDPAFHGRTFSLDFGLMTVMQASAIVVLTRMIDADAISAREAMAACGVIAIPVGAALGIGMWATRRAWG